jgi:hypothetical protein
VEQSKDVTMISLGNIKPEPAPISFLLCDSETVSHLPVIKVSVEKLPANFRLGIHLRVDVVAQL